MQTAEMLEAHGKHRYDGRYAKGERHIIGGFCVEIASAGICATGDFCVVTNAIAIRIRRTGAATDAQGVELAAIAVAISSGDSRAAAGINLAGTVANPARVEGAHAVVDIIANAIAIRIRSTGSATDAQGVELVAITVAIPH